MLIEKQDHIPPEQLRQPGHWQKHGIQPCRENSRSANERFHLIIKLLPDRLHEGRLAPFYGQLVLSDMQLIRRSLLPLCPGPAQESELLVVSWGDMGQRQDRQEEPLRGTFTRVNMSV